MPIYSIKEETLVTIADAIRTKNNTTAKIKVSEIPLYIKFADAPINGSRLYQVQSIAEIPSKFWSLVAAGPDWTEKIQGIDDILFGLQKSGEYSYQINTNLSQVTQSGSNYTFPLNWQFPYAEKTTSTDTITINPSAKTISFKINSKTIQLSDSNLAIMYILFSNAENRKGGGRAG